MLSLLPELEPLTFETTKIKVLLLYINYPFALGTYFKRALQRRSDVDLKVCGQYTGSWIPWMGGMNLPEKYAISPDIPLPFSPNVGRVSYDYVKTQLEGWTPDLIITCDAGVNWSSKPRDGYVATIGTDPHVLHYTHARSVSDKFFNMQKCYSEPRDVYLPYAYDPTVHYPEKLVLSINNAVEVYEDRYLIPAKEVEKDTDCVLIGMPYPQRIQWVDELRKHGASVIFENSPVFDEYRELANRARIGLNWSSLNDLNARFFETPAFGLAMVTNRVPDANLFLQEGIHYLGFGDLREAVEEVLYLKNHPDVAELMAMKAHQAIQPHTYDARIEQLLEECGF